MKIKKIVFLFCFCIVGSERVWAAPKVDLQNEVILEDSEEPFSRRIYSYDVAYDSQGDLQVVYSQPVPGQNRCRIIYTYGKVEDLNNHKIILSENGKLGSVSTWLRVDQNDVVHISYIEFQNDPDTSLMYRTVTNSNLSGAVLVAKGGWHTKMALNQQGAPVFLRDGVHFMQFYTPQNGSWSNIQVTLPDENYFRGAQMRYDSTNQRYHISYGDDYDAASDGKYSHYKYAYSDNGRDWVSSTINNRVTLWEMEFWTDLVVSSNGKVYAGMMEINRADHFNATGLFGAFVNGSWTTQRIAGNVCPEGKSAAGGGLGFAFDKYQVLYGIWDDSPIEACNGYDGAHGNIIMGYSEDANKWQDLKQLKPYSAEGRCAVAIHDDRLALLVLGDHTDTHLHLIEYSINGPNPGDGKALPAVYFLLKK